MTTREYLVGQQYATDGNLAARQAIYRFQQPLVDLHARVLELASLSGDERIVDAGCGNGMYLERLRRLDHAGPVVGFDLSPGMVAVASAHAPAAVADVTQLPLSTAWADVTFCNHMLYHVPDMQAGAAELRRVTRPGGVAVVVTNSEEHLAELNEFFEMGRSFGRFTMENGGDILGTAFDSVEPHQFRAELVVDDADALVAYVASMQAFVTGGDLAPVEREIRRRVAADGAVRIRTAAGCFVCR